MTSTQLLEAMVSVTLQIALVMSICSWLDRGLLRSIDRCRLWNTCQVCMLGMVAAALLLPRLHLLKPWVSANPKTLMRAAAIEDFACKTLLAVWAAGAAASLGMWVLRGWSLRRKLSRCEKLQSDQMAGLVHDECARHSITPPIVLVSDEVEGPYCTQLHWPVIVIPRMLLAGAEEDFHNVLVHECAHLRSNHPVHLFLQNVISVVCWFHPSVWRATYRASLVREYACDDAVIDDGVGCATYLRTLLRIAEQAKQPPHSSTLKFGKTPAELVLRAKRLVDYAKGVQRQSQRGVAVSKQFALAAMVGSACLIAIVTVPTDPMTSSRSHWSTWPTWTATTLHCIGISARDYERFDRRVRTFEQIYDNGARDTVRVGTASNG